MDWIHVAQGEDRMADFYEHGNEPSGSVDGVFNGGSLRNCGHSGGTKVVLNDTRMFYLYLIDL
jgi:hypothetical protein